MILLQGYIFLFRCICKRYIKNLGYKKGDLPNVERLANCGVAIPMFPELTEDELKKIVKVINDFN